MGGSKGKPFPKKKKKKKKKKGKTPTTSGTSTFTIVINTDGLYRCSHCGKRATMQSPRDWFVDFTVH